MNKTIVVAYNPNSDMTQVSWYEGDKKKSKSFSSETSVTNFIETMKPCDIRYRKHIREGVSGVFKITEQLKTKANELLSIAEKGDSGCLKLGANQRKVWIGKTSISSHRLVFFSKNPDVPQSYFVKHKCLDKTCINPEHLFAGWVDKGVDAPIVALQKKRDFTEIMKVSIAQAEANREVQENPSFVKAVRGIKSIKAHLEMKEIEYNHSYESYIC